MSDEAPTIEPGEYESADGKQRVKVLRMHMCDDGSELAYVEVTDGKSTWWLKEMFVGWRKYIKPHPWTAMGWKVLDPDA